MSVRTLKLRKNPDCPVCGTHPTVTELIDYDQFCGIAPAQPEPVGATEKDGIPQMTVTELKRKRDAGEKFFLLDVREPYEYEISKIKGSTLVPLGDVAAKLGELSSHKDEEVIIHCRSGARSQTAALQLKEAGFKNVSNVAGGINAWATEIDKTLPTY